MVSARTLAIDDIFEIRRIIKKLRPAALFAAETLTGFHLEPGFIENGSSELLAEFTPAPLASTLTAEDAVVKFLAIVREGTADEFLAEVAPAVGQPRRGDALGAHRRHAGAVRARGSTRPSPWPSTPPRWESMPRTWWRSATCPTTSRCSAGPATATPWPAAIRKRSAPPASRHPHFDDDGVAQILEEKLAAWGSGCRKPAVVRLPPNSRLPVNLRSCPPHRVWPVG